MKFSRVATCESFQSEQNVELQTDGGHVPLAGYQGTQGNNYIISILFI